MQITEVQITPIKATNGLIALASVVYDNALFLSSIGIYTRVDGNGYRITYPTKSSSNHNFNIYHPINKQVAKIIEQAILVKAKDILSRQAERSNDYVRYNHPHI